MRLVSTFNGDIIAHAVAKSYPESSMVHLPYADRVEAGRLLARELCSCPTSGLQDGDVVVLALARGGVPVGFAVADRLCLPLDIIVPGGGTPALNLEGRPVVLIDDGLATGNTMMAAVRHVRTLKPASVIIGVPVGPREACDRLRCEVDHLFCLAMPHLFCAVGEWYRDFEEVSDVEVRKLVSESRRQLRSHKAASAGV
jgi:putative phosphoribosyl transferase